MNKTDLLPHLLTALDIMGSQAQFDQDQFFCAFSRFFLHVLARPSGHYVCEQLSARNEHLVFLFQTQREREKMAIS